MHNLAVQTLKNKQIIVTERLSALERVIKKFSEQSVKNDDYEVFRDALIRRFKHVVGTFWKFINIYLQDYLKVPIAIAAPRGVLRAAVEAKLISHQELNQLLDALTDRNISSHAYDEDITQQVAKRIPAHYAVIKTIFGRLTLS